MKKTYAPIALAAFSLSACSVYVDGESVDLHKGPQSSLMVNGGSEGQTTISCTDGREPYSQGGENGEPLVMGCRDVN
jgi:hypothetical protein